MESLKSIIKWLKPHWKKHETKNPVHKLADFYYHLKGWDVYPKEFWKSERVKKERKYQYARNAAAAKKILFYCEGNLDEAMKDLWKTAYLAEKGGYDWRIETVIKKWERKEV